MTCFITQGDDANYHDGLRKRPMLDSIKPIVIPRYQLSGTFPNTLQDILEEAIEPWLKANDYL